MNLAEGVFSLGRIRGIDIRVHWSWLLIFWFLAWVLATDLFADEGWTPLQRWTAAVATSLLFFLSVLLHELAHSFVAQGYGLHVPSITLFVFGGVSSLADEPKQPRQEFAISIVGPLTSWALAVVFGAIWFPLRDEGVGMVPGYLAGVNLLLGAFNLLPGFPLDGGRVLRSVVWGRTKSFVKATRVASNVGTGIAWTLIVLGLVNVFAFGLLGGLWYVLVGLFLKSAAQGSYQAVVVERTLGRILAEQVMQPPPDPIEGDMTIQQLVDERVLAGRGRCYFIGTAGAIVGLITSTDVAGVPREEWRARTVSSAMVPAGRVITVEPKSNLIDALKLMQQHDIHQLPVLEQGRLVGVLTRGDIMRQIELRQEFAAAEP